MLRDFIWEKRSNLPRDVNAAGAREVTGRSKDPGGFVLPWVVTTAPGPEESPGWGLCSQRIIPRQV